MSDVYQITWDENGQSNTVYVGVSELAAVAFVEGLGQYPTDFTNVELGKHETSISKVDTGAAK